MAKLGINYCVDIMKYLRSMGFELRAPGIEIKKAITIKAGFDDRTRTKYFGMLQTLGFIKPVGEQAPGFFDLDYEVIKRYK